MWILQEYRFYLIIAVIALAGIIFLFFRVQESQDYTTFDTERIARYAQVKSTGSESSTILDSLTVDGIELLGTTGNNLFGLTLEGAIDDITLQDKNTLLSNSLYEAVGITPNTYRITFITSNVLSGNNSTMRLVDISPTAGEVDKGWTLDNDGAIAYSFESNEVAERVMQQYLPEGYRIDNHIFVPFSSNQGSKSATKEIFEAYANTSPLSINQDEMCEETQCLCTANNTTINNGDICDSNTIPLAGFINTGLNASTVVGDYEFRVDSINPNMVDIYYLGNKITDEFAGTALINYCSADQIQVRYKLIGTYLIYMFNGCTEMGGWTLNEFTIFNFIMNENIASMWMPNVKQIEFVDPYIRVNSFDGNFDEWDMSLIVGTWDPLQIDGDGNPVTPPVLSNPLTPEQFFVE